jgi:hypothetical protein
MPFPSLQTFGVGEESPLTDSPYTASNPETGIHPMPPNTFLFLNGNPFLLLNGLNLNLLSDS